MANMSLTYCAIEIPEVKGTPQDTQNGDRKREKHQASLDIILGSDDNMILKY